MMVNKKIVPIRKDLGASIGYGVIIDCETQLLLVVGIEIIYPVRERVRNAIDNP